MINKAEILKTCILQLEAQLREVEAAARASAALATDDEHRAKSKYDTFSLETSYLARGQAKRVEETREALSRLRTMPLRPFTEGAGVQMGALVEVVGTAGEANWYFLVPAGGGEEVQCDGEVIQLVTLGAPIAQGLVGKKVGDAFTFAKQELWVGEVI